MGKQKIFPEQLRDLVRRGLTTVEIAPILGVTVNSVRTALGRYDLVAVPCRNGARAQSRGLVPPPPPDPDPDPDPTGRAALDPLLAATGGRYADLAALAERRGVGLRRIQQQWHALGLSPQPRPRPRPGAASPDTAIQESAP